MSSLYNEFSKDDIMNLYTIKIKDTDMCKHNTI